MKKEQNRKQKGFTLIELLVVVSIIGLLSSIVLAAMKSARDKANVAAFVQNIRQLQIALEMYKTDTGFYPYENDIASDFNISSYGDDITSSLTTKSFLPIYISQFPKRIAATDTISYMNPQKASDNLFTCNNAPIKGYLIVYVNSLSSAYNIPLSHLYYSNSPQPDYCVTGS